MKKRVIEGTLDQFNEQGMEGGWVPTVYAKSGPSGYNATYVIRPGDYLKIFDKEEIVWEGVIQKDREEMRKTSPGYYLVPVGITAKRWFLMCMMKFKVELTTAFKSMGEESDDWFIKQYGQEKFDETQRQFWEHAKAQQEFVNQKGYREIEE